MQGSWCTLEQGVRSEDEGEYICMWVYADLPVIMLEYWGGVTLVFMRGLMLRL